MTGIPTRRVARRGATADENAPPAATTTMATRSRAAASSSTAIPTMKRTTSALNARAAATAGENQPPTDKTAATRAGTKRRGLETTAPNKPAATAGKDKGKAAAADRRPLASTTTTQTLRSRAAKEPAPAAKRKATSTTTTTTRRTVPSRGASVASQASTSTSASTSRRVLGPTTSLSEAAPAAKRFKSASPEDVLDAHYDDDNRELVVVPRRQPKDQGWTDLDAEDEGDPSMVSEYVNEAFKYMLQLEEQTMPSPTYMDQQDELQWKMRAILNDWIIEVHGKFRLLPETLFIATNLIDRFLTARMVSLVKFQLVGLTALFVAAKYEEVICPSVTHFLHMTDGGFDVGEILRAERYLLSTLEFDLSYPNPLHFLRRVSKADCYDVNTRTLSKYFIEISCVDHHLLPYPPSMLAAAAMWLSRLCFDRGPWHANMVHYSGYSQAELLPCAQAMLDFVVSPDFDVSSAFHKKYASKKHHKASTWVRDWATSRWPASAKGRSKFQGRELEAEFGDDDEVPPPPPSS